MTQSIEGVRFRVVSEEAVPNTANLATQIYETYVAPVPERGDAASLPDGATDEPEVMLLGQGRGATVQGTLPPLQATPGVNPSSIVSLPSLAALTDKEVALLQETLKERLEATEAQALQALLRGKGDIDEVNASTRSRLAPLPARTVNRYRLGAMVVLLILLGTSSSVFLNRPQGKGLVLPNAPTDGATPTAATGAAQSVAPTPVPQLDATLTSRNVALDAALQESEQQMAAIALARRDYLLAQADWEVKKNGTPVEVWLIRRLNMQMLELRRTLGQGGQFSGDAKQISTARSLVGDARAILLALREEWQNPNAAPGRNRVAPAILTKQMSELAELARVVREASYEQQLRDAERVKQQERPEVQTGKPEPTKKWEVQQNGVLPSP